MLRLILEAGTHGESGASARLPVATELGGGTEHVLMMILEAVDNALVILSRLKLARQLIAKVHFPSCHIFGGD